MQRGLIYRDKQGQAELSQVFIISKGIVSWLWLVSLLDAGAVGFYTASHIMRGDSVVIQDMDITHYDSIFGAIKDVSNVLWDAGLCLLQATCAFMV